MNGNISHTGLRLTGPNLKGFLFTCMQPDGHPSTQISKKIWGGDMKIIEMMSIM